MKARSTILAVAGRGHLFKMGVLGALMFLMTLLYASTAWAATFTVTNTSDRGAGSLRAAIEAANANAGADEVVFADGVSGTITLGSQLPTVTDAAGLTIDGDEDITVSGNHAVRVFTVGEGAKLTLKNLTVADGFVSGFGDDCRSCGGGILSYGTLEVTNVILSGNNAEFGGAISKGGHSADLVGTLTVTNSTISGNSASNFGGGIYWVRGAVTVTNSTISDNTSDHSSGGIYSLGGKLRVANSAISGNSADFIGGGIYNDEGSTEVINSTFSGNSAFSGGGIYGDDFATTKITNSTLSGNRADNQGGGISTDGRTEVINSTLSANTAATGGNIGSVFGATTLNRTIVANSLDGGNCQAALPGTGAGTITDAGYNIDSGTTCGFSQATGSLSNTNPLLDPAGLQDNGGSTKTIALLPDSPAVDLVGEETCPPPETDQRGVDRPQGEACDSGAFELEQEQPPQPQTKDECKKGGHKEFGFKNQGRCIAFVNRTAHGQ